MAKRVLYQCDICDAEAPYQLKIFERHEAGPGTPATVTILDLCESHRYDVTNVLMDRLTPHD